MNVALKQTKKRPAERVRAVARDAALLTVGGVGYYLMEVICRGYSHWSMAVCGGVCLLGIFHMNARMRERSLPARAAVGAVMITAVELVCGCIVNLGLNMKVWDYSRMPMNLMGQICLPFTLLWFGLCIPICLILGKICRGAVDQKSR